MHFEVNRVSQVGVEPQWCWKLINEFGRTVAYGDGYGSKLDCEFAITSIMAVDMTTPVKYDDE